MKNRRYNYTKCLFTKDYSLFKPIFKITSLLAFLLTSSLVTAQDVDNELEYRSDLNLSFKLNEKLKLSFTPEIRFNESFNLNKYLFEGGIAYKPIKFIQFQGTYRYIVNPRTDKETEYFKRHGLSIKAEKEFGHFTPGIRIKYTNDADDEITDEQFIRYRLSLDYDIPKCKVTPKLGLEAFQQLGEDGGIYKMRYSAGLNYKLLKNRYLSLVYKLDYHYTEYLNKHIIGLSYNLKF